MNDRVVDVICADTKTNCTIMLGRVSCDGYKRDTLIGAFSHFHSDHIRKIQTCISDYDVLIAHPITFEAIDALYPGMKYREQWVPQNYDTEYRFPGGTVRLLKANHIPGSAQVYVESDGTTMLYSGDFKYPDMQIRHADYLVIDSTHGNPWFDGQTDRKSVKNRLFEHIEENIEHNPHIVITVSSGTLQEIIRHFEVGYGRKMRSDIEFIMDDKQYRVLCNLYRAEKSEFRATMQYDSPEFWRLVHNNKKCLIFTHPSNILDEELQNVHHIMVDTYKFDKDEPPIHKVSNMWRFNLGAHASITEIYQYVEAVKPKYVITDNSRGKCGRILSKLIMQRFPNIRAEYRPSYDV